jgi:homoaconitate hydratase
VIAKSLRGAAAAHGAARRLSGAKRVRMGQTVVEKIAQAHMTSGPRGRLLRAGDFLAVRPRHVLTHDNTSPVIKKFKGLGATSVLDPRQPVFALDHDIQNKSEENLKKYRAIEVFAREQGIAFYPAGTGIGHQVMCENLYVVPGAFVVASDSHSNMYGALGAVGTPVVRTDAAAIWAIGEFWWQIPATLQVVLHGKLQAGTTGKDVIIALCGSYGEDKVLNTAIEFGGEGVASLSVDERMSIANMTTEWGALVGWFPVDEKTVDWVSRRVEILAKRGVQRVTPAQIQAWRKNPPQPDKDAAYAARITLDLSKVTPHVAGPDSVQKMSSLAELETQKIKINKAYLLSCVNSRLEDLQAAAEVLRGKKIAPGVRLYLAAASREVQEAAQQNGAWQNLVDAGATVLPPSCGPCIGLGEGLLESAEVGISATNRNFKGRMGARDAKCYLASPAVVAASAIAGTICGPTPCHKVQLSHTYEVLAPPAPPKERVEILDGFPARLNGRLVYLPVDNLNTDGIYGKDYTYRDDVTPEMMSKVVMENYDPEFAGRVNAGDILVGGFNFGTGSSREQAATALKAKGLPLIIAGSFSQTYQRNAFNNGVPLVECSSLARHLFAQHGKAGQKTVIPGDAVHVDFTTGTIAWAGQKFTFAPLGSVPQELVIAGGVESVVTKRLAAKS